MSENLTNCPVCGKNDFSLFLETSDFFLSREAFSILQCRACGFKFVNPRPGKTEIGRYYQSDEYISHDAKGGSLISRIYKLARVFSIRFKYKIVINSVNPGKILDVGCGTGEFLKYCKSRGFDVSGVEPNDKARTYAQQENGIPVTPALSDIADGPANFSCITMWHVLEHLHDLNEAIAIVKGRLLADGVFIVAVPNCNSWDALKYGKFWAAYDVPRHLYHFTESTIHILAEKHGFDIIQMHPQKLDAFYVSMLSEKYLAGRINYFKALFSGLRSNFMAGRQGRGHSSQIFVLSQKKA